MTVGEKIRAARKAANLTQKQLGARLGISYVNISQLEGGQRIPSLDTLQKIADALQVPIHRLIPAAEPDHEFEELCDLLASVNLSIEATGWSEGPDADGDHYYVWHDGVENIVEDRVELKYSDLRRIVSEAKEASEAHRLYYLGKRLDAELF